MDNGPTTPIPPPGDFPKEFKIKLHTDHLSPKQMAFLNELRERERLLRELQTVLWHEFARLKELSDQVELQRDIYAAAMDKFIADRLPKDGDNVRQD
jgi:hypothetical protein